MSIEYNIYRFSKPSKKDIQNIKCFSSYDTFEIQDANKEDTGEYIHLFRWDDKYTENIRNSRFSMELTLPEKETDYDNLYRSLGFSEDSITNHRVHFVSGTGYRLDYSDEEKKVSVMYDEIDRFEILVQTHCFAVKMKKLWSSSNAYCYPDHDRVRIYLPEIDSMRFVPICNQKLAKAEIPFLIFDRYKGMCFLEKD